MLSAQSPRTTSLLPTARASRPPAAWALALCALATGCQLILDIPGEDEIQVNDPQPDAGLQPDGNPQPDANPPQGDAGVQTDAPAVDWWNATYPYRARLTISVPGLSAGSLQDVPVLVHVNATRTPYLADTADTGLRFVADDGAPLDHQIETWDPAGDSFLWVRVPTMDSASSVTVWLYYGAPAGTAVVDPTAVWDADYLAVWHLQETAADGGTVDGVHQDSTSNGHDGDQNRNGQASGPGIIGGAQEFDGDNDWISVPTENGLESGYAEMTITARVYLRTTAVDFPHIIAAGGQFESGRYRQLFWQFDNAGWAARYRAGGIDPLLQSNVGALDQWSVVAMTYDGFEVHLYLDGQEIGVPELLGGSLSPITSLHIGGNPNAEGGDIYERDFDGYIDELRISTTARSTDWLLVQNLSMNDGLVTYGPSECLSGCP